MMTILDNGIGQMEDLLKELANAVGKMSEELSSEEAEQAARDLETLTAEATSSAPRQKWWQLSVEGLEQAAKNVGKVGVPVLTLAVKIAAILSGIPAV
jgi:methionyl-tRNA synthetase